MAMILCPDCGKQLSDQARNCPNCGRPIIANSGIVSIKIRQKNVDLASLFLSKKAVITNDETKAVLWSGARGQVAKFRVDKPTRITITLDKLTNPVKATVYANKKYVFVQDVAPHWKATFYLSEVDVIDSD